MHHGNAYMIIQQCNSSSVRLLEIDMADLSLIAQAVMLLGPICCEDAALKPCRLEMHLQEQLHAISHNIHHHQLPIAGHQSYVDMAMHILGYVYTLVSAM